MRKSGRKAGRNIRDLAMQRRLKAILSFSSAGFLLILPFILRNIANDFLSLLPSSDPQTQADINLPFPFYLLFVVASCGAIANGLYWWKRANHADQGARGEEAVSQELIGLEVAGWQVEYGMRLGKGLGDADIFCISPRGRAYVIDVKSHRGTVLTDGKKLYRKMGNQKYAFEKDFLKQVMKQAFQVKQQKNLQFVTPIIAFSDARVAVSTGKIQNVYVVEKSRLPILLERLG